VEVATAAEQDGPGQRLDRGVKSVQQFVQSVNLIAITLFLFPGESAFNSVEGVQFRHEFRKPARPHVPAHDPAADAPTAGVVLSVAPGF
jgi:hypothetical protein